MSFFGVFAIRDTPRKKGSRLIMYLGALSSQVAPMATK